MKPSDRRFAGVGEGDQLTPKPGEAERFSGGGMHLYWAPRAHSAGAGPEPRLAPAVRRSV
jgi:hypothetical protein